jgi:hypothetical protein
MSPASVEVEPEPERSGLLVGDRRWRVAWLKGLRRPPADATWPRLMTVPHPRAAGSLGPEFIRWAEARSEKELRWWQRLVATRMLEVDKDGKLVWETIVLSVARQLGKSWLLRELCLWRIHQGERFGEPQDVLHTGKDIAICKEVQRQARFWARSQPDLYKVTEVNGQESIEYRRDVSRWMVRAKGGVYGYAVSLAAVDEAWKVKQEVVDEGLTPTMAEREQPQLLLVSTAHRLATPLMIEQRKLALDDLERGTGDVLLLEWSAAEGAALDDLASRRQASPHWSPRRARLIERRLAAAMSGESDDPDEPDPVESFRAQWLNQWPRRVTPPSSVDLEDLLPAGLWADLVETGLGSVGPVWVAVEDDFGLGAAVAACSRLPDGRLEVDGWLRNDWDTAIADVQALHAGRPIRKLLVGASLVDRVPAGLPKPQPQTQAQVKTGLALLRDLVVNGQLVHDTVTYELDDALNAAKVREAPTGLFLAARGPTHLVKAAVWAVQAAHKPVRVPAVR